MIKNPTFSWVNGIGALRPWETKAARADLEGCSFDTLTKVVDEISRNVSNRYSGVSAGDYIDDLMLVASDICSVIPGKESALFLIDSQPNTSLAWKMLRLILRGAEWAELITFLESQNNVP